MKFWKLAHWITPIAVFLLLAGTIHEAHSAVMATPGACNQPLPLVRVIAKAKSERAALLGILLLAKDNPNCALQRTKIAVASATQEAQVGGPGGDWIIWKFYFDSAPETPFYWFSAPSQGPPLSDPAV